MDGSHRDIFVTSKTVLWPNGLSLDIPAGRLYWVDAFYDRIETILLNGTDRKVGRHVCIANPCSYAGNSVGMWKSVCPGLCAAYMFTHGSINGTPVCLCIVCVVYLRMSVGLCSHSHPCMHLCAYTHIRNTLWCSPAPKYALPRDSICACLFTWVVLYFRSCVCV